MTPQEIKQQIFSEYARLMGLVIKGKLNGSAVYRIIEGLARDGARHNGIPDSWNEYMPQNLMDGRLNY